MGSFFKWGLLLCVALGIVFSGFLWLLGQSSDPGVEQGLASRTSSQPSASAPSQPSPSAPSQPSASALDPVAVADQTAAQSELNTSTEINNSTGNIDVPETNLVDEAEAILVESESETAKSPDQAERQVPQKPSGTSYLAGRVLDGAGRALTQVTVLAAYRSEGSGDSAVLRTRSDAEGRYQFENIATGDYSVSNAPINGFGERTLYVRSGSKSVDLVLERLRRIQIIGIVRDLQSQPISGVEINTAGSNSIVRTAANGAFSVSVEIQADHSTSLRFSRDGFVERIEAVNAREIDASNQISLNVTMNPLGSLSYSGRVIDDYGDPVVGELVRLYSTGSSQAQRSTTDESGAFAINGVSKSDDWYLTIIPKQAYERHEAGPFRIDADVVANDIILNRSATASISGTIVDGLGSPVGNLSLVLSPSSAPGRIQTLVADDVGRFQVDEIAAGELRVSTQSQPHMDISGITLAPGDNLDVTLVVDRGEHALSGVVIDANGQPVASAEVLLTWTQNNGGLISNSFRDTTSDANGLFSFTELGAGAHQLSAVHSKHPQVDISVEVGLSDEVVQLRMQ